MDGGGAASRLNCKLKSSICNAEAGLFRQNDATKRVVHSIAVGVQALRLYHETVRFYLGRNGRNAGVGRLRN
jgi:hypothetical protein